MNFVVRSPDIWEEIALINQYEAVFKSSAKYVRAISVQICEAVSRSVGQYYELLLPDEKTHKIYNNDCDDSSLTALICAWCLGREFAETNQETDPYSAAIKSNDRNLLPEAAQVKLTDIEDFGAENPLKLIREAYSLKLIDEIRTINFFDLIHQIYRDGVFYAFKDGVVSFFRGGPNINRAGK